MKKGKLVPQIIEKETEVTKLIDLIAKRSTLSQMVSKELVLSLLKVYYSGEIPSELMEKIDWFRDAVIERKKELFKELTEVFWSNLTKTKEIRKKQLIKSVDNITEITEIERQAVLPTQIIVAMAEQAFGLNTSTIEVDALDPFGIARRQLLQHTLVEREVEIE
ncbi:MAG: hypothetical protein ACRCY4_09590 [Brevinema sp.]